MLGRWAAVLDIAQSPIDSHTTKVLILSVLFGKTGEVGSYEDT